MASDVPPYQLTDDDGARRNVGTLEVSDGFVRALFELAARRFDRGDLRGALEVLRALLLLRPADHRVLESIAVVHQACGNEPAAVACYQRALRLNPEALHANVNLGELAWRRRSNAAAARAHLGRVVSVAPDHPVADRARATLRAIERS